MVSIDPAKEAAGKAAADLVESGMRIGLGTGSTVNFFLDALAERHKAEDLDISCVVTSDKTEKRALDLGLPVIPFLEVSTIDLTIDGADEIDPRMNLIKGGGGALLREKIVAAASKRMIVIADESKRVETLGAFPLPVEVIPFGWLSTLHMLTGIMVDIEMIDTPTQAQADADELPIVVRMNDNETPFVTDEGNFIFDLHLGSINDALKLNVILNTLPGVVENGLFVDIADGMIIGKKDGSTEVYISEFDENEGDDDDI